jgi:hypothetical protein
MPIYSTLRKRAGALTGNLRKSFGVNLSFEDTNDTQVGI